MKWLANVAFFAGNLFLFQNQERWQKIKKIIVGYCKEVIIFATDC